MKPYDIVLVRHADYSHFGQVISRPTSEETIMVRMVPGDATTMKEIEMSKLSPPNGPVGKYIHYAEVFGSFGFPVDMLRYDHAAPVNFTLVEGELGRIEAVPNGGDGAPYEGKLVIAKLSSKKNHNPWTEARWASFGWQIKTIYCETLRPNT